MSYKTILVIGDTGFIGTNFITYFLEENSKFKVFILDKLTYVGELSNLKEVSSLKCSFVKTYM